MELKAFKPDHLDMFDWNDHDKAVYSIDSQFTRAINSMTHGETFSAFHEGRLLVIGGAVPFSKKTAYAFSIFSKWAKLYPLTSARIVRRMFQTVIKTHGYHRLVTVNPVTGEDHNDWCHWLGFQKEAILRKYDDAGNDYVQYGYVT